LNGGTNIPAHLKRGLKDPVMIGKEGHLLAAFSASPSFNGILLKVMTKGSLVFKVLTNLGFQFLQKAPMCAKPRTRLSIPTCP
jgi:hypothetical protein